MKRRLCAFFERNIVLGVELLPKRCRQIAQYRSRFCRRHSDALYELKS
jgi:hypothetical protein